MSLYMFTSCGWFFDDLAGIEAVQNLKYASRAIELVREWSGKDLRSGLLDRLAGARTNDPHYADGADLYRREVEQARIGPAAATAHFGMRRLVDDVELDPCHVSRMVTAPDCPAVVRAGARGGPGAGGGSFRRHGRAVRPGVFPRGPPAGTAMHCLVGRPGPDWDLSGVSRQVLPALEDASIERAAVLFSHDVGPVVRFGLEDLIPDSRHALALGVGPRHPGGVQGLDPRLFRPASGPCCCFWRNST